MHILYIHQYFATPRGHTGTRSYEFARRWVAAGHRVTMLTSAVHLTADDLRGATGTDVLRVTIDGINVVALRVEYLQTMGFVRRAWAFVDFMRRARRLAGRLTDVDVIYASSTPLTVGVPAMHASRRKAVPFVFEVRDPWPAVPIALGVLRNPVLIWAARRLERKIYRRAAAIITLSPGMTELVRSVAPAGQLIETIPNCADTELFHPGVDGGTVRRERGWGDRFVCLHTGAMGRVNGLDVIVRAAQHFRDNPQLLFVLMGEGKEKARLQAECTRLGVTNLQILDAVPKNDLPAIVAAADLCLMTVTNIPILQHNSANKFFDYLSAGKPVLLNYSGWKRDALEGAKAGYGCVLGDDNEFFSRIDELKKDQSLRGEMGRNAREIAETEFDRDQLSTYALNVLERTIDNGSLS